MDKTIDIKSEQLDGKSLLVLIKEAAELSRMSAMVSLAYSRAKTAEAIQDASASFSKMVDDRITSVAGPIKENSKLYDDVKAKKAEITQGYEGMLATVAQTYGIKIEQLLAERAQLENENLSLAADCENLRAEKAETERRYKEGEKRRNSEATKAIASKKAEAERLAKQGDIEGARTAIEDYKKLKEDLVMETTEGMLEVASISQQVNSNRTKAKNNTEKISAIDENIQRLEEEAKQKIEEAKSIRNTDMVELNKSNSIFRKMAMFASKVLTRAFNKGKAISDEVIAPMKVGIDKRTQEVEQSIGMRVHEIKEKVTEPFRDKLDKAMQIGRNVKQGAIEKLTKAIQERIAQAEQNISTKKPYLESDREEGDREE